jgi:hypothetical protein
MPLVLFVFLLIAAGGVGLKGWMKLQHRYVCAPKVRDSVQRFLSLVRTHEYETLDDNFMFADEKHFMEFKTNSSNPYSLEIKKWRGDGAAYVLVRFGTGGTYALMLVPDRTRIVTCWGAEYKVVTVR